MSLVMVSATSKYIILTGDGRVSEKVKVDEYSSYVKILDENFKKIRVINNNVLIGFTGHLKSCIDIMSSLDNVDVDKINIDDIAEILIASAKGKVNNKDLSMVVCGINNNNKIQINTFTTENDLILNKSVVEDNGMKFISLTNYNSNKKPGKIYLEKIKDINTFDKKEMLDLMEYINHEISKQDFTVNDNMGHLILNL